MDENGENQNNQGRGVANTPPLVAGAQQEQSIYYGAMAAQGYADCKKPAKKWSELGLDARLTIILTAGIFLAAVYTGHIFLGQADIMQGQLSEMHGTGLETHSLIMASIGQLNNARRLAEATETANRNVLNEDRPWIGIVLSAEKLEIDKSPNATLGFINSGKRPAKVLLNQYRHVYLAVLPTNPEYGKIDMVKSTSILIPNTQSTVTFTLDKMTEAIMTALDSKAVVLYVYASIDYTDPVTNQHHWTHACWEYIPNAGGGIVAGFYNCPTYNEAN